MLKNISRALRTLTLRAVPRCQVLQFGGTELSSFKALAEDFVMANMPLISEQLNLRVLSRCLIMLRLSRWDYYREYIKLARASLLVVWHDTNIEAYQIQRFIDVPVYCIQNGSRHDVGPIGGEGFVTSIKRRSQHEKLGVSKYFVFGSAEIQLLCDLTDTDFVAHGSFLANEYVARRSQPHSDLKIRRVGYIASLPARSSVAKGRIFENSDLCLRLRDHTFSYHEFFAFDAIVVRAVMNVCRSMGKEFAIVAKKPSSESTEADFFRDSLGEWVNVVKHPKGEGYRSADQFDCLITIDSTLGYEMMALGKPVAFFANRMQFLGLNERDMTFGFPLDVDRDGSCWSSATSVSECETFLRRWMSAVETSGYEHDPNPFGIMNVDPKNSLLRSAITESLATGS